MPKQRKTKSTGLAYVWLFTLGLVGAHQYYLGNGSRGTLYVFTLGLFFVGWTWDLFTLSSQTRRANGYINTANLAASSAELAAQPAPQAPPQPYPPQYPPR